MGGKKRSRMEEEKEGSSSAVTKITYTYAHPYFQILQTQPMNQGRKKLRKEKGSKSIDYRSVEESIKTTVCEKLLQGEFVEKLRESIRKDLPEEVREEVCEEESDKIMRKLKGQMESMIQEMVMSKFDQRRHGQSYSTVPSVNTQVPDASSAHHFASNNIIGLEELQLNNLPTRTVGCNLRQFNMEEMKNEKQQRNEVQCKTKKKKALNTDVKSKKMNHQIFKKKQKSNEDHHEKLTKKIRIDDATWKKIYEAKKNNGQNADGHYQGEVLVNLLDYKGLNQVVARGVLISKDSSKIVGGVELGSEFWEVLIKEAIKPNERLIRPYEGVNNLGEAIGKSVAWSSIDITERSMTR